MQNTNISFEETIINNCIGFGSVDFSFDFEKTNYEKSNKFLLYRIKEKNYLGVFNLNTYESARINNFDEIIQNQEILKKELYSAVEFLVDGYIKNYDISKQYNIPIENLNDRASHTFLNYYNTLETALLKNNNCIEIENNSTNISNNNLYTIISELFKFLLTAIKDSLLPKEMQEN